jgi:ribonuclease HI
MTEMKYQQDSAWVYCDGSCSGNPGPGGWGAIVVTSDGHVKELGGSLGLTTNNQMELRAAIESLRYLKVEKKPVHIFTDSSYVIKGITQWISGWAARGWLTRELEPVANSEYWKELWELTKSAPQKLHWHHIPGHAGIAGNERADEIAVAIGQGIPLPLYEGPVKNYSYDIFEVSLVEANERGKSLKSKGAPIYLSLVNGKLERHTTWKACEAQVKGRPGARYKKINSPQEEKAVLAQWGVKS